MLGSCVAEHVTAMSDHSSSIRPIHQYVSPMPRPLPWDTSLNVARALMIGVSSSHMSAALDLLTANLSTASSDQHMCTSIWRCGEVQISQSTISNLAKARPATTVVRARSHGKSACKLQPRANDEPIANDVPTQRSRAYEERYSQLPRRQPRLSERRRLSLCWHDKITGT